MNPRFPIIPENDITILTNLLSTKEGHTVISTPQRNGIWLHDVMYETELRILLLMNIRLTITNVNFCVRRQGTMTQVLQILLEFCRRNSIPTICIQSASTKEMVSFCHKFGFSPDPGASMKVKNMIVGDYIKNIKTQQRP